MTDHGAFLLFNVYAPNAGERPARARLPFKLKWFEALRAKIDSCLAAGREVVLVGDVNIPRSKQDVHTSIVWDGLYSPKVCCLSHNICHAHMQSTEGMHSAVAAVES